MDILEIDAVHTRGMRTFVHTFCMYGWWLSLCGIGFLYLAYMMHFGAWAEATQAFLNGYPDYGLDTGTVALWSLMFGVSFIFVAWLRANVMYRMYKFTLDEHAFRLRRGLFRIREFTFPYAQVANVHVDQPYHWRLLGLASLDIISSSESGDNYGKKKKNDFLIPLMDKNRAKILRAQILRYGSGESSPYDDMYGAEEDYDEEELYEDPEEIDTRKEDVHEESTVGR